LQQRVALANREAMCRHRFYWWNNAAVEVWEIPASNIPMRFAAAHGFAEGQRWPVDSQEKI